MPLGFFTAILDFKAVVRRSSLESDPDPFQQAPTGLAEFTPIPATVRSEQDQRTYFLQPILARITNGVLMSVPALVLDDQIPQELPGDPADHRRYGIRLTANTNALGPLPGGLDYRVRFSRMVFDKGERKVDPFSFTAPNEADVVLDLSTVVHRSTKLPVRR